MNTALNSALTSALISVAALLTSNVALAASPTVAPSMKPSEKNSEAESDLRGPLSRAQLEAHSYPWMKDGVPAGRKKIAKDAPSAKAFASALPGTDIEVYFGSWCSDSHDHLPVFLALLDAAQESGMRPKSLKLVALDRKKTYAGYANDRQIEKLPTFVFLKDGREIGRIIETPEASIAADSVKILKK